MALNIPRADEIPAIPGLEAQGDNIVRLADAEPDTADNVFVFEFAIPPKDKINFQGVQALVEVPIPGAEGSILQDLGSEPLRISWDGVFEDVFSAEGTLVRRAIEDVQTLEDMRVSGKIWTFKYLDLIHAVKIKEFNYTPVSHRANLDRFEYTLSLTKYYPTLGFEQPQSITAFIQKREQQSARSGIKKFFDDINSAVTAVSDAVVEVSDFVTRPIEAFDGTVNEIFDELETTGDLIEGVVDDAAKAITAPQRSLENLQQRIDYNITTTEKMLEDVVQIAGVTQATTIAFHDVITQLKYVKNIPVLNPSPPVTYTVIDGDRIEDISQLFYGDFEAWRVIADANILKDPTSLQPGQVLIIPS